MPRQELTIFVDDTGEIKVEGPIDNRVLCYGLLAVAYDAIQKHHEEKGQIVAPVTAPLSVLRGGREP
jgi:hypothetical protein